MTPAAKKQALAMRQLNNAANNLFDASDASEYSNKRENLVRAAHVALALAHTVEYGEAYLPQFRGNADAFVEKFPRSFSVRVADAIRKTTHERG